MHRSKCRLQIIEYIVTVTRVLYLWTPNFGVMGFALPRFSANLRLVACQPPAVCRILPPTSLKNQRRREDQSDCEISRSLGNAALTFCNSVRTQQLMNISNTHGDQFAGVLCKEVRPNQPRARLGSKQADPQNCSCCKADNRAHNYDIERPSRAYRTRE